MEETYTGLWGPEWIVKKVKVVEGYYSILLQDPDDKSTTSQFALEDKYPRPKAGDKVSLRVPSLDKVANAYLLGVKINGEIIWNRSDQEDKKIREEKEKEYETRLRARFEIKKNEMDRQVALLPDQFRRKIERLRKHNPDFRWKYEEYELFCCREAVKIISKLQTIDAIEKFVQCKDPAVLRKLVPNMKWKQHFGQALAVASHYAHFFATNPRLFHLSHGAMANFYGCREYGCLPATQEELSEVGLDYPDMMGVSGVSPA